MRILKQKTVSFAFAYCVLLATGMFFVSCQNRSNLESVISDKSVTIKVNRFDLAYKHASVLNLDSLMLAYPFFFPEQTPDSVWRAKLADPLQKELLEAVSTTFSDFDLIQDSISHLYGHLSHYFPAQSIPELYTLTNEVVHQYRVITTDSMWLVALDNYLGPSHEFYKSFPSYIRSEKDSKYMLLDLAASLAKNFTPRPKQPYFISKIVYEGKKLLLQELFWPHANEAQQLHYTTTQYEWASENEDQIWRYFMDNELLYSTQTDLEYRFLYPAPFTKFNLSLDKESPPRLGQFIGLQIVKAHYEKYGEDLQKVLRTDAVTILKEAAYKPKK